MKKLVCFSGVEAPDGFAEHGEYRVYGQLWTEYLRR
jgi:hypothetical protein